VQGGSSVSVPPPAQSAERALAWLAGELDDLPAGAPGREHALRAGLAATLCADWVPAVGSPARDVLARARSAVGDRSATRTHTRPGEGEYTPASGERGWDRPGWDRLDLGLLLTDPAALAGTLDRLEAATRMGLAAVRVPEALLATLEAILLAHLQDHRLAAAARLLRLLAYLGGERRRVFVLGIEFLALVQDPSGSFGFFDRQIRALERKGEPFAARQLQMEATVACLWTLAETTAPGGYRLVRDLGRGLAACNPAARSAF
jgi:hypothetical protein